MTEVIQSVDKTFPKPPPDGFGVRYVQAILCFFMMWIIFATRQTLTVAIVAMTDNTTSPNPKIPTYNWNDKSVIMSSFAWGYILPQIFVGNLSRTYGSKWFLVASLLFDSLACLCVPLAAEIWGSKGVMGCRMIQGLSQGVVFPVLHTFAGKWVPSQERSKIATFILSGMSLGTISAMLITGLISASWAGWPTNFYIFGAFGLVWIVAWILLSANSPDEHKSISREEKNYIETSLGSQNNSKTPAPWRDFFYSMPLWAIIFGGCGYDFAYSTISAEISIYLNKVMNFNMNQNAWLATAPYIAFLIVTATVGVISDYVINSGKVSRTAMRKIFNTIGTLTPAAALLGLAFIPEDQTVLSIILLILSLGTSAACCAGFIINHLDLSPNHAGVLVGITNVVGLLFGVAAPLFVHVVVHDETDRYQWRIVFVVAASVYVVSNIFYVIFASGEVQYWNESKNCNNYKKKEKKQLRQKIFRVGRS